jgi:hypothetical protein
MSALNGATFAESTFGLSSFAILASFNNAAGTISGLALDSFGSAFTATSDSGLTISQIQALVNRGDGDPGIYLFGVPEHADNAAALLAGLFTGVIYRTGDTLKIVH